MRCQCNIFLKTAEKLKALNIPEIFFRQILPANHAAELQFFSVRWQCNNFWKLHCNRGWRKLPGEIARVAVVLHHWTRRFQDMGIPRKGGQCLAVIYSNIVALNTKIFSRYVRRHPSKKIRNSRGLKESKFSGTEKRDVLNRD